MRFNFRQLVAAVAVALAAVSPVMAEALPARGSLDSRIRSAVYDSEQVYRIHGYVGYQIDIEFEAGETFVGLGAGDVDALSFVGQDNHLFIKPKAAHVATNLTVMTTRHCYQFDYTATAQRPERDDVDVVYALRFTYPAPAADAAKGASPDRADSQLDSVVAAGPLNTDYWYCGHPSLQPEAASDNGVHTRLRFSAQAELPAIFVRNGDGSESLLNFNIDGSDVIIHRIAPKFILRRGKLTGCVVNAGYAGSGVRLDSGTISPDVHRDLRQSPR